MKDKINILHLTYDYAVENKGNSTIVINNFISNTSGFTCPIVISLKRSIKCDYIFPKLTNCGSYFELIHFGFPLGILLFNISRFIAKFLLRKININNINIIHAHKLTFEGFIGYLIAKKLNKPLFLSIRQTDFYVLRYRPDLLTISKSQLKYATKVFIIAPYMINVLKKIYGENFYNIHISNKMVLLPNSINLFRFKPKLNQRANKFISICWMKKEVVKRKNLYKLLLAVKQIENIKLDIIGHGDYEQKVRSWIKNLNLEDRVKLLGFIPNEKVSDYLSDSIGFLMPSFSETFGVAYAEALACGIPILYSKGTGFDGLFEQVGVCVNPYSVEDIKRGIEELIENNIFFRNRILKMLEKNELEIFSKESISKIYQDSIYEILIQGKSTI